jgi:hypothetical protein
MVLYGVKHGQEQLPARARCAASVGKMIVLLNTRAALPERFRRTKKSVDRRDLIRGRRSPGGPYIH